MSKKIRNFTQYIFKNLLTVVGIVLIWRGVWEILDLVDAAFFANNPLITAIGGVILGLILLYLPDKDLKEIEKL